MAWRKMLAVGRDPAYVYLYDANRGLPLPSFFGGPTVEMLHYSPRIYTYTHLLIAEKFLKKVHFSLNILAEFGIITIASSLPLPNWGEVADSGAPQVFVSADTEKSIILYQK